MSPVNVSSPLGLSWSRTHEKSPPPCRPAKSSELSRTLQSSPPGGSKRMVKVPAFEPDSQVMTLFVLSGVPGMSTNVPLEHPRTSAPTVTLKVPWIGVPLKSMSVSMVTGPAVGVSLPQAAARSRIGARAKYPNHRRKCTLAPSRCVNRIYQGGAHCVRSNPQGTCGPSYG